MPQEPSPAAEQSAEQSAERQSIWERIERPAKAQRTTLSHDAIAAAAVEVADAEGLDAVSMRKLSGHLGVTTMALYRYVVNKDELFELMLDKIYGAYRNPEVPGETWRDVVRVHAAQVRAISLAHPWIVELTTRQVVLLTPNVVATMERMLAAFDGLGLDADTSYAAQHTVTAYIRGAMTDEVGQLELMKRHEWTSGDDLRDAYSPQMMWLMGTGRYPALLRFAMEAQRKDDFVWRFESGLDSVLEGIGARFGI
ncbi:TetR/AcrR family transcriptional regulator [Yinghuangia soli]|uniref:TetR/AcrR family transcriptional regulator n=1 Tax=Yinghuangia soli TaxID=2908204 RepID=A0AA41PZ03_9ACTN|nr:TetR/AcrR family transcriptional regulator [Yinghuangia soli]MCF2528529.1 TetR/AcrR family transcriptional regulator [Yinghuangia soli]